MAVTKLDKAKVSIVTSHPFFASILLKRQIIIDESIPTAAVDQRGQIYLNPQFAESRTVEELVFLLCHEIGHVIGQHAARRGERNAKLWNIAGDAWINDMLRDAGIGEFIKGGVDMPGSKDRTVDGIYDELNQLRPHVHGQRPSGESGDDGGDDAGGGGGDDDGGPSGPQGPGGIGDDLIERGAPLTQDEADRIDADTRVEIAQAALAAKSQGKLPGALEKLVAELLDPGTPWYDVLERYMTSFARAEYSWSRPNRRFASIAYLPSVGRVAKMGEVVIQVDVSGSISKTELDYYNGHLRTILEQCSPERVHVLYTDTGVCRHDVFESDDEFALEFFSGGGTDMEAGFDYLAREGLDPEVFVCLTDGYTDFNQAKAPGYPVVWCISSDIVAPYGDTIHFSMEQ